MTSDEYPLPDPADYPAEDGGVDWRAFREAAVAWANAEVDRLEAEQEAAPPSGG